MVRAIQSTLIAVALAMSSMAAVPANAGERWRRDHERHDRTGEIVAAGVLGLAVGALIAGVASDEPVFEEERYVEDNPYRRPRPSVDRVQIYAGMGHEVEPWSRDWFDWCERRYRSFNPDTGTFTDYDGRERFCVAE